MRIVGHRGAKGLAPENTLRSIEKALQHAVDEVEIDVRVTGDEIPVLHHDRRLTGRDGKRLLISDSTYSELKEHKPDLCTLEEALAAFPGATFLIEVKPRVNVTPIVRLLELTECRYLLGSKSQKTLCQLHDRLPDAAKVVIEPWSGVRATSRARQVGAKRLNMNQLWLWGGFIRAIQRGGYELYPYAVNNVKKARRWHNKGIAGVITDYPDLFD